MRKIFLILYFLVVAFITIVTYQTVKREWVIFRKAEQHFFKKEFLKAIPFYKFLLETGFKDPLALIHLGESYLAVKEFKEALAIYEKIVGGSLAKPLDVMKLGNLYEMFGQFDKAIALFQTALQTDPGNRLNRIYLARALTWKNDFEGALRQYCKVLGRKNLPASVSPNRNRNSKVESEEPKLMEADEEIPDWLARWELAKVLFYMKRYDESIAEYKKLIKEKPDLMEAKVEMAEILFFQRKLDDALMTLTQVPAKEINDKGRILMADIYGAKTKYEKAEFIYRNYLKTHPEDNRVRLKLAEMLSWYKKYDASLYEYETILKTEPHDIQIRRKYAFVLIWAGRFSDAAVELKKTLK